MCCREGLDKPPKASMKSNTVKTSASQQPIKQATTINRSKLPTALHGVRKGEGQSLKATEIEKVDLTMRGKREGHTTLGPQRPKDLNRLHSSVQKTAPVDLITQRKPVFSYAKGRQPSLSFLDETVQDLGKASSDYDDDTWMADFPSPSALVENAAPAASSLPSKLSGENHGAAYDESISELEACMVGLDDSITLDNYKADRAPSVDPFNSQNDLDPDGLGNGLEANWSNLPKPPPTAEQASKQHPESKSQRIFMSTDSLQKPESSPISRNTLGKRRVETLKDPEGLTDDALSTKKRKVSGDYGVKAQHITRDSGARMSCNQEVPAETGVKLGWEGIDPALFAEYGDIVDMVEHS